MSSVIRRFTINKPWNEVVQELLKEGCQVKAIVSEGAILQIDKDVAARLSHIKEN
jgi:hypothetical protein